MMESSTTTATMSTNISSVLVTPAATPSARIGFFGAMFYAVLWLLQVLPRISYWILSFTTYTLPTWLFTLFSTSFSFTMNFTTILAIALLFGSAISWFVRYRYLTMYARLPPEPQRKEPQIDLFPDTGAGDSKAGLSSYLDEFLSAIKVFGYLERPVFHELTRHMQTRKLIAGETFMLEEEKGFCLVVDGLVQVFVKSNSFNHSMHHNPAAYGDEEEEESHLDGDQGYQLLTEVKNGAPMSSLFTILSLFTEDVQLRQDDEEEGSSGSYAGFTPMGSANESPHPGEQTNQTHSPLLPHVPPIPLLTDERHLTESPNQFPFASQTPDSQPSTPHSHLFPPKKVKIGATPKRPSLKKSKSVHPDIIARATIDTTIAIIPAAAFKRLTKSYPKASGHIVSVILTRFLRVTFATARTYLGLSGEVLRAEKSMNKYTMYDLPNYLRGAALERLKERFDEEREAVKDPEELKAGILLNNQPALKNSRGRRGSSVSSTRKGMSLQARIAAAKLQSPYSMGGAVYPQTPGGTGNANPGDLWGDPTFFKPDTSRQNSIYQNHGISPFSQGWTASTPAGINTLINGKPSAVTLEDSPDITSISEEPDEGETFREAVLECLLKALGLTSARGALNRRPPDSVEQSPRLVSYDARRQKAVFNSFGFLDQLHDLSGDGDTESVASSGVGGPSGGPSLLEAMKDDVEIVFFPKGSVLVEQGERSPGLYYVIDGFLDVSMTMDEDKQDKRNVLGSGSNGTSFSSFSNDLPPLNPNGTKSSRKSLFMIKPGGLAGYIGSISGYRSFVEIRAKTDCYVGFLPRANLERIVDKYPVVLLTMAKRLTTLLPRLMLHIDFALEWLQVNAGEVIYRQGDDSDAIYIVLNGRLRAVNEGPNNERRVNGEYGQGESVGELEVLTESTRPATLHAIRDTEVARFPKTLFNSLALEHPGITIQISKIIATRMRAIVDDPLSAPYSHDRMNGTSKKVVSKLNLRTVCILPVAAGVPVTEFADRLSSALQQIGTPNGVVILNQATILNHLGRHAFSRIGKLKLSGYLADLEEKYGMVLYVADTSVNAPWTQTCISQADCILLVALAEADPTVGEYERFLVGMKTTARKELVLLHAERFVRPGTTRQWLRNRMWINGGHHHIQMAFRPNDASEPTSHQTPKKFGSMLAARFSEGITKYTNRRVRSSPIYTSEAPFKGDFHRLARRMCGKTVGLVLGGGGARGIAQVGVIRALEEEGIPIDVVGGTSIGAFVGALYARDADIVPVYGWAKKFAGRMASLWRFLLDLTYPSVSYTTGHEFNRGIYKTFSQTLIEDFWLEFYCNTTSISHSRMEIHTSGYAWRYVRASMSLAGLLPPMCDEGSMLLDGGYVDNLTVAHMKSLGADVIFAVDVGAIDDDMKQNYGDTLSGGWTVFNRWNPFSSHPNPPTLAEIQARLAYVSSVDALERAKNIPGCYYMRPPIDAYGTLDFGKFDEIYQVGYVYAKKYLEKMKDEQRGRGEVGFWGEDEVNGGSGGGVGKGGFGGRRTRAGRRASI